MLAEREGSSVGVMGVKRVSSKALGRGEGQFMGYGGEGVGRLVGGRIRTLLMRSFSVR